MKTTLPESHIMGQNPKGCKVDLHNRPCPFRIISLLSLLCITIFLRNRAITRLVLEREISVFQSELSWSSYFKLETMKTDILHQQTNEIVQITPQAKTTSVLDHITHPTRRYMTSRHLHVPWKETSHSLPLPLSSTPKFPTSPRTLAPQGGDYGGEAALHRFHDW